MRSGSVEIEEIHSTDDPRIRDFTALTDMDLRRATEPAQGLFIAESFFVLERVLDRGLHVRSILVDSRRVERVRQMLEASTPSGHVVLLHADALILEQITGYRVHRGVLASVERPHEASVGSVASGSGDLLVLEGLVDPTNVGLSFRSAAAFGMAGAILSPDCADPLYRRAVRTSMAATISLPWARSATWPQDLAALSDRGYYVVALSPDPRGVDLSSAIIKARETARPVAAVFGAEGAGLTAEALRQTDAIARIPMAPGIDSLNVAATVAVVGYALR